MEQHALQPAIDDFVGSGLTPDILGVGYADILKSIIPMTPDTVKQLFPNLKMVWNKKTGELRTKKGYIWQYNGTARLKNLDPEFLQFENGQPKVDPHTGLPEPIRYLGTGKVHLYMDKDDIDAAKSPKGSLIFIEGEKKRKLVRSLIDIKLVHHNQFRTPHISTDFKYACIGGSGIYNFIPSPEWGTLNVKGKPIYFVFDSDWNTNTQVAMAELKMVASLIAKGAAISRIKSLSWPAKDGKGIDDYLVNLYRQANTSAPFILSGNNGNSRWEPVSTRHPMLSALSNLFKTAEHPFKKYSCLGIEFICHALTSIYKVNTNKDSEQIEPPQFFTPAQEEEIILALQDAFNKRIKLAIIRATFGKTLQIVKDRLIESQTFRVTEDANGKRLAEYARDQHIYNYKRKTWMSWTGLVWEIGAGDNGIAPIYQTAKEVLTQTQAELAHVPNLSDEQRREIARKLYGDCQKRGHKLAIIGEARDAYPWMQIDDIQFDSNPYILNLSNCVIHLDRVVENPNEALAQHTPGMYCSHLAPSTYHPDAQCPKWREFIDLIFQNTPEITPSFLEEAESYEVSEKVMNILESAKGEKNLHTNVMNTLLRDASRYIVRGSDIGELTHPDTLREEARSIFREFVMNRAKAKQRLVDFVQQVAGLGLSGLSTEKILLFAFGEQGDNGKSTFMNVMEEILGGTSSGYFYRINMNALQASGSGNTNSDAKADLRGKRFVVTSETNENRLDVSLLKELTGAEGTISAMRKYEKQITFPPSHTFWLMGNMYPTISVTNDPFWSRVQVIPFDVHLPSVLSPDELLPQEQVLARFRQEKSGILNWMLEGWCDYRQRRLVIPDEVRFASLKYQGAQDKVGLFLQEECVTHDSAKIKRGDLYAIYRDWIGTDKPLGKTRFYREIEQRGYAVRTEGANNYYFYGIGGKAVGEVPLP